MNRHPKIMSLLLASFCVCALWRPVNAMPVKKRAARVYDYKSSFANMGSRTAIRKASFNGVVAHLSKLVPSWGHGVTIAQKSGINLDKIEVVGIKALHGKDLVGVGNPKSGEMAVQIAVREGSKGRATIQARGILYEKNGELRLKKIKHWGGMQKTTAQRFGLDQLTNTWIP